MPKPKVALIIGGAGTGKTTHLLNLMDKVLAAGIADPREIGFVSFTRAARSEAANRAADRFGLNPKDLEQYGWFRTLHSICYKQLACGNELLAPGKDTAKWITEQLGQDADGTGESDPENEFNCRDDSHPADTALRLWHLARNRLVPFAEVYERSSRCDERTPDMAFCKRIIERYEQGKRLDHRCDFTDMLGRFAGWAFQVTGPLQVTPAGPVPDVPVWFIDEAQDHSPLIDAVARRLTENARWVYLVGDPWQAIYGFAGADPRLFQAWPIADGKRRVLDRSWRCPARILELGEACLRESSDYWNRNIQPNGAGGSVETTDYGSYWLDELDPREPWLILARTNFVAHRLTQRLAAAGVPWTPLRGNGGWKPCLRSKALAGLLGLPRGDRVGVEDWQAILDNVPSRLNGVNLFVHGTKKRWDEAEVDETLSIDLAGVAEWGATEEFVKRIRDGRWVEWIDRAADFKSAFERWGWGGVLEPKIRIGTIHAAKGMEADNVLLLTTTSRPVWNSSQDQIGSDEERRLAYVAVTRAKRRVIVASERTQFRMEVPV